MGILDKIKFWKHEDDLDFDKAADKELGLSQDEFGLDQEPPGLEEKSPFETKELPPHLHESATLETTTQSGATPAATSGANREMELISSKLDTVKAILASLDQRMANLEKIAGVEQKEKLW